MLSPLARGCGAVAVGGRCAPSAQNLPRPRATSPRRDVAARDIAEVLDVSRPLPYPGYARSAGLNRFGLDVSNAGV